MDAYGRLVGLIVLGILAAVSLSIMGICAAQSITIPASIGAAFGTCVGTIAGMLTPQQVNRGD